MAAKAKNEWWRGGIIYQVYPRSFNDSNNDGIGDLAGITAKLPYIKSLGVDAIWISPFFKSPMKDFGYDVSDYCDVDPIFGTMADFDTLVEEAKKLKLKVMIDLVLSHTSTEHPWFMESRANKTNPKADWYVWADPKPDGTPPNNWLSIFGGSAWEYDAQRRQYYLHNFLRSQPDLNFHNPEVRETLLGVAKFWLDKGVHGFRLDTVNFYFHDEKLRSNPPVKVKKHVFDAPESNPYTMQQHIYDKTRPENLKFLEELRRLMDQYPETATVGEMGDEGNVRLMASYTQKGKRLHMAYSFSFLSSLFSPEHVRETILAHEAELKTGWPCWAFGNHDVARVVSRWNARPDDRDAFAKVVLALLTTLRGSICLYQGEELGLPEADVPYERLQDPYGIQFWPEFKGRDGCRTPMPWVANSTHAGFSQVEPWLPVPGNHAMRAVDVQEVRPESVLNHYRTFLQWRQANPVFALGSIEFVDAPAPLLAYIRRHKNESVLVVVNLGTDEVTYDPPGISIKEPLEGHGFASSITRKVATLPGYSAFFARIEA